MLNFGRKQPPIPQNTHIISLTIAQAYLQVILLQVVGGFRYPHGWLCYELRLRVLHVWGTFSHDVNFGINISEPGWRLFHLTVYRVSIFMLSLAGDVFPDKTVKCFHSYRQGYAEAQRIVFSPELNSNSEVH